MQPGIVLDELRNAAGKHGLTFGPDPATHSRNTLGGMIGNNSCGIHSMMAGETVDNIDELDIVTLRRHPHDGRRDQRGGSRADHRARAAAKARSIGRLKALRDKYADRIRKEFPMIPRRVSGFNLPALLPEQGFHVAKALVGTEGTCVLVLEAKTKLVYNPPVRSLLVFGYPDIFAAADNVVEPAKFGPIGLEALDDTFIDYMKKKGLHPPDMNFMPEGNAWLLIEFGGKDKAEADANARKCMDDFKQRGNAPPMKLFDDPAQEKLVWHLREEGLGATAKVPDMPENHEGWEDSSVPPDRLGALPARSQEADGQVRLRRPALWSLRSGMRPHAPDVRSANRGRHSEVAAVSRGSVGSGGQLRRLAFGRTRRRAGARRAAARMYSPEIIDAFREFKAIWDPDWKMNPGKVIDPYRVDENLREGTNYNLPPGEDAFPFPGRPSQLRVRERPLRRRRRLPASRKRRRNHVPELHGDARREALDARPRAPAERDDPRRCREGRLAKRGSCAKRSTCASPARAASTIAPCRWTWRLTRPSSCRTTTNGGCARVTPMLPA